MVTPSFTMTSCFAAALSSNPSLAGPQLLHSCSPLLELAVRQALNQCVPHFGPLSIRGRLEVSLRLPQSTQSTTILQFDDPGLLQWHVNQTGGIVLTIPQQNAICNGDSSVPDTKPVAIPGTSDTNTKASHDATVSQSVNIGDTQPSTSSSRRKSTNPIKCTITEQNESTDATDKASLSVTTVKPDQYSPSADSGVLDLSRTGSAPITPFKQLSLSEKTPTLSIGQTERNNLMEAYRNHLFAFNPYQNIWNQPLIFGQTEHQTNEISSTVNQPSTSSSLFQIIPNGARSAPSSPIRPVKRQRVSAGRGRGGPRASTGGRRLNSNRRFPCNQCRQDFTSLHDLEQHTVSRHGTYRCHICKAMFTQRSNLQRHALKHVGFKPFECRVCKKAYYRKDHLMRHMEMGHPGYVPRDNITVHLTSSESLEYLSRAELYRTWLSESPTTIGDPSGAGMDVDGAGDANGCETHDVISGKTDQSAICEEGNSHFLIRRQSLPEPCTSPNNTMDGDADLNESLDRAHSSSSAQSEVIFNTVQAYAMTMPSSAKSDPDATVSSSSSSSDMTAQFGHVQNLMFPRFVPSGTREWSV